MFNINEVKKFISCGIQTNQIEEQNVFDNRLIYSLNKNNSVKLNSPRYLYKVKNYKLIKKTNFNREYNLKRNNKFVFIFTNEFSKFNYFNNYGRLSIGIFIFCISLHIVACVFLFIGKTILLSSKFSF